MLASEPQTEQESLIARLLELWLVGERGSDPVQELFLFPQHEGQDQMVLGGEVPVDGLAGHAGRPGHVFHLGPDQPDVADALERPVQDPRSGIGAGRGHRGHAACDSITTCVTLSNLPSRVAGHVGCRGGRCDSLARPMNGPALGW